MKKYLLISTFIFSFQTQAKTTQVQSDIFKACAKAFSKSSTGSEGSTANSSWSKSKVADFCGCYTKNMSVLISKNQVTPIIKWLENKMTDSEQEANEALLDMEYEVTSSCDENSKWIAEKAKKFIK
jgi:hypothetical protein